MNPNAFNAGLHGLWQGWPPQAAGMFGGPVAQGAQQGMQWPGVQHPFQAMPAPPPPPPPPPPPQHRPADPQLPSVQELVAAVAVEMQSRAPVGSSARDDYILIGALRKGKADGLTPRQAIEKLHNVNDHTSIAWMYYFLDHLEKLYPKAFPFPAGREDDPVPAVPPLPSTSNREPALSQRAAPPTKMHKSKEMSSNPRAMLSTIKTSATQGHAKVQVPVPAEASTRASRRGSGPMQDFHDETCIPPSTGEVKPKPPRRDKGDDNGKFMDDDKIFFIHFLRWRLRELPIPDKKRLYQELAEHAPHHSADAWKQHWDDHPRLPDEIYIEARKRDDLLVSEQGSDLTPLSESSDPEEIDVEGNESDGSYRDARPQGGSGGSRSRGGLRVTEEDLRAMARYKVSKGRGWYQITSRIGRWREFAKRPENHKRSQSAWSAIDRHYGDNIDAYCEEFLAAARKELASFRASMHARPELNAPGPSAGSSRLASQGSSSSNHASGSSPSLPRKRRMEESVDTSVSGDVGKGAVLDGLAAKRIRGDKSEVIELSD